MSTVSFKTEGSFDFQPVKNLIGQPKMLLSPCNHVVKAEVVSQMVVESSAACSLCKKTVESYRPILSSHFDNEILGEIEKADIFVQEKMKKADEEKQPLNTTISSLQETIKKLNVQIEQHPQQLESAKLAHKQEIDKANATHQEALQNLVKEQDTLSQKHINALSEKEQENTSLKEQVVELKKQAQLDANRIQDAIEKNAQLLEALNGLKEELKKHNQPKIEIPPVVAINNNSQLSENIDVIVGIHNVPNTSFIGICVDPIWSDPKIGHYIVEREGWVVNIPRGKDFKVVLVNNETYNMEWEVLEGNRNTSEKNGNMVSITPVFKSLQS